MHKRAFIYKIENQINNQIYIGCTVTSLKKRFEEHKTRCKNDKTNRKFCNSLNKHGSENFNIILLEECDVEKIYEREIFYINKFQSYENGLNSTIGGEGCIGYVHSSEIRMKISENLKNGNSHKGKTYDEIYGENQNVEKIKRSESVKKYWKNITEKEKKDRINEQKKIIRLNSKYSENLIKEIKDKFRKGKNMKEMFSEYPEFNKSYLYSIKNNRRWKDI